jgi:signal transduction histidine kinase
VRRRLFAWLALAALASAALTAAVTLVLAGRAADRQVLRTLERQADVATVALAAAGAPPRAGLRVFDAGGRLRRVPRVRAAVAADGRGEGRIAVGGREIAFVRRNGAAGPVAFVRPARAAAGDAAPVGRIVLVSGLAAALVAAALAAVVAGRITRPLRALERATGPVAGGRTGVRVPVDGRDEVAALARAFNAMADELDVSRAAERRFLMQVGHELRTPLTSVRGYAEALEDGAVGAVEAGRTIGLEAIRLERLVGDLQELAALRAREFAVAREPVDLGAVARAAADRHAVAAGAAGVTLRATGAGGATGDGGRLLQAISNLVENALRVTPAGGTVEVAAAGRRIEVRDTGPGLPAEDLVGAPDRREHRGGHGLGLAIVRELVAAMGGRMAAHARAGGGTCFAIELSDASAPASP